MFLSLHDGYKLKSLMDAVKPFAEAPDNKELQVLLDEATTVLYEQIEREALEEITRIKKLPDRELLDLWYSCYSMINIYECYSYQVQLEMDLYGTELVERGMVRHMEKLAENGNRVLSASAEREYVRLLQRMLDAELLEEWNFYGEIVDFCNHQVREDCQKKDLIELELGKRGINEAKGEHSEQSYN